MADIVLRDRNGTPVEYPGVERVKLSTVDGETVEFVDLALIPEGVEKIVELDFSGGAITVIPEAGQAFSKVNIPVPEGLAPENIPDGMTIAGIVGAMVTGGGGGNAKFACGSFTGADEEIVINHGFGVTPDIVSVACDFPPRVSGGYLQNITAISEALKTKIGTLRGTYGSKSYSSGTDKYESGPHHLTTGYGPIKADENTITINNSNAVSAYKVPTYAGSTYYWFAIGGLDLE